MTTVYVERTQGGAIKGVYRAPQPGQAEEAVAEDAAEVLAFMTPSDPTARRLHPFYFRLRFTQAQRTAFDKSTDDAVIELRAQFMSASSIGLDDPRTAAGLDLMVAKGIIARDDKAALLADRREGEKP